VGNRFKLYFNRPSLRMAVVEEIDYEFQGGVMVVVFEVCGRRESDSCTGTGECNPERRELGGHLADSPL